MIDTFYVLNEKALIPAAIGGVLLFILFIWKEWKRPLKSRFYVQVLAAFVSIFSLVLLLLQPAMLQVIRTNAGVLLTDGFQEKKLDSLTNLYKNLKQVTYEANQPMTTVFDSLSPLFILGDGVAPFDFWQLEDRPATYLGSSHPNGITKVKYDQECFVGDNILIYGRYTNPLEGHKLVLTDGGGNEIDSVLLEKNDQTDFELSAPLKVQGNYAYHIREKDSLGKVLSNEPLPIRVLPRNKLKLVMVNSFPTFESKYLKNFLAEAGHELTVRSQLTRGKFKFEYFNTVRRPFYSFSAKMLESFDVILIDASSYRNLTRESLQLFDDAIKNKGLGLFILPNSGFFRLSSKTSGFRFSRSKNTKLKWKRWPQLSLEKYPFSFDNDLVLETVHYSESKPFTAYRRVGNGRIGTSLIQNSYQLLLDGNSDAYEKFWSEIISQVGKRKTDQVSWNSEIQFPVKDEPFTFEIRTAIEDIRANGTNGIIPLKQNPDIPELWYGTTYPRTIGWHTITTPNDTMSRFSFYVTDSLKWKAVKSVQTIAKNKIQFGELVDSEEEKKVLRPIDSFWFFLIFITAMGYLWLSPKIFND